MPARYDESEYVFCDLQAIYRYIRPDDEASVSSAPQSRQQRLGAVLLAGRGFQRRRGLALTPFPLSRGS